MLPRQRVLAALNFQPVDVVPLEISPAPGGLYEHGDRLLNLIRRCGHDFGDLSQLGLPEPLPPEDFRPDGSYHAFRTDEWGVTWEYLIPGVWGHPCAWPLKDLSRLATYRPPVVPALQGDELAATRAAAACTKERYFLVAGGGSLFERLHSLRPFEDVLVDIALDTPEINRIADMVIDYNRGLVRRALAIDADAVAFGDDFGTQTGPFFRPEVWRRFFKPRYEALFEPVLAAGKDIFFHSCGQIEWLLEDLKELGVSAIWPQLPLFDLPQLARRCRELGLAVKLHPDRGELMQWGTPDQVRAYVHQLVETFGTLNGGSWMYIEIDPGFQYANVEALIEIAMELRQ